MIASGRVVAEFKIGGYEGYVPGLVKCDAKTGRVLEFVDFVPGSADIHDVSVMDGQMYGVDGSTRSENVPRGRFGAT